MSRKIFIIAMSLMVVLLQGAKHSFAASVTVEVGADTPAVSIGETHCITARVLLRPSGASGKGRAPIAAALVIDKSGSMQQDGKIENAKRGALEALKMLGARDIAAVIAYDTRSFVITKARAVNEMADFAKGISRLEAGGSTALYDGVKKGAKEIERFLESGYIPRIILLSDGLANVGPSSVRELASLGRSLSRQGITITTIGLGLDYDEDLMTALAAESGGNAYFARTRDRLEDIFRRDMEDATAITGRGVRITLSCEDGVRPIRSVGRTGKSGAKEIVVDIENLYGAEKYAIFELEVPASDIETTMRAATIKVEYTDALLGSAVALESSLDIEYTSREDYAGERRNIQISAQAETARNAEILEQAVKLSDSGKAEEASALLRHRVEYIKRAAPIAYRHDKSIQEDMDHFSSLAEDISTVGGMSNEERKSNVNKIFRKMNQQSPVSSPDDKELP